MNEEEMKRFNEADKKVHPVETQWHHPILVGLGFEPVTKEQVGFVRRYEYVHPKTGRTIKAATGMSSDYWEEPAVKKFGYWSELEPYLKSPMKE